MNNSKEHPSKIHSPEEETVKEHTGQSKQLVQQRPIRESALRQQRMDVLIESCQQEILKQIIGPFGLTPAMFEDKRGGNMTTQHNANQGIFAKDSEELDRDKDYNYSDAKKKKKKESVQQGTMTSETFIDQYTGKEESSKRTTKDGKTVANFELDHLIPVKELHRKGGWMLDKQGRDELSSVDENLHYTTHENNRKKGATSAQDALSEDNGYDPEIVNPKIDAAKKATEEKLPGTLDRVKYHSKDAVVTGAKEAGKTALRQAFGILLHEFVSGSFAEVKIIVRDRNNDNLLQQVIESVKRVMKRVASKVKASLNAAIHGGIQGFLSNLLTFLINNFITTAKKVVTLIRESTSGLWEAIKMMISPPEGMTKIEVARQVTKIISGAVTTALGLLLEESVKAFLLSSPVAPLADILSPALTAIITGIASALVIYGVDRIFDWLSATGTEMLKAMENALQATGENIERMAQWLDIQLQSSQQYSAIGHSYSLIEKTLDEASRSQTTAMNFQHRSIEENNYFLESLQTTINKQIDNEQQIGEMLNEYLKNRDNNEQHHQQHGTPEHLF